MIGQRTSLKCNLSYQANKRTGENSEHNFPQLEKDAKGTKNVIITGRKYEEIKQPPSEILRHKVVTALESECEMI